MAWAMGVGAWVPRWLRALAFWTTAAVVVVLSLLPTQHLPEVAFNLWDKAQHAFGFAVLTFLGLWAYPHRVRRVLVGMLLLGAMIELAQGATGWRHGDWLDLLADAVGVAAGAMLWLSVRPFSRALPPRP